MPLYEFHCAKCDVDFEELVMTTKPEVLAEVTCPVCGSRKVSKKVSTFASSVRGASSGYSGSGCAPRGGG
jgi:putative FmdB family regulatory protein